MSEVSGPWPIVLDSEDDRAALVALAGLPGLSPRRLWSLLALGTPQAVWQTVVSGRAPCSHRERDAARAWPRWARSVEPDVELQRHQDGGVAVLPFGHPGYPDALLDDPEPPAVIFRRGPAELDDRTRIAIVGTRKCTPYGIQIATELGEMLAARGIDVVSGLASGIDAAAHAGANRVDPERLVAVVAGGVDVIYPKRNRGLFAAVAAQGALLSEWPLGASPQPWRFPARNRLVAALSAAVVVVESLRKGGSMYTVEEALDRNRAIFAVPGSIYSPQSSGANKLIADGAHPLYDFNELIEVVAPASDGESSTLNQRQGQLGIDSWLLEAIGWEPVALAEVVDVSGRAPSEVTLEVERLIASGAVRRTGAIVQRVP